MTIQVRDILEPIAAGLATDGVHLEVAGVEGTTLHLSIAIADDACAECVVSDELVEAIVLGRLKDAADEDVKAIDRVVAEHIGTVAGDRRPA